jgi:uncharacterized protein YkwD
MRRIIFCCCLLLFLFTPSKAQACSVRTIETDMLAMINEARAAHALAPLEQNYEATRVAQYKCEEMMRLSYADHYSPVHGSPADMLSRYKIPFEIVGENIAAGNLNMRELLNRWLNEARGNILFPEYREMGIGYCRDAENSNSYWVLLFIS